MEGMSAADGVTEVLNQQVTCPFNKKKNEKDMNQGKRWT